MRTYDQPQQHRRMEEPPRGDDRRKQVTNPAHAPVPANPPVESEEVKRGREKLERILN
jgi:hypothetical protein